MARRLANFVDSFCQYAGIYNTTPLFAKTAAIWMIGTAAGRAIGMEARGNALHPNLFFQLVGGPGTGKSQAIKAVRDIFLPATKMSIIPASITRAGLEDYMKGNFVVQNRRIPDGRPLYTNECIGLSEEMQGILPDQDLSHLTLYSILYDLPDKHVAVTRSHGEVALEKPYCSILTGAQPAFLAVSMLEQAWGMGFMSRSIMVFDQPRERTSMFKKSKGADPKLKGDLIADLKDIHSSFGWMTWSDEAIALYEEWFVVHGGQPIPQAKRLAMGYNARRELHMTKIAMCLSLARSSDLVVELQDCQAAIELLLFCESRMKNVFSEMSNTGSMIAIEDVLDAVRIKTAAGEFMGEAAIIEMLMGKFPPTQVHSVVENLISSRAIQNIGKSAIEMTRGFRKFQIGAGNAVM